MKKHLNALYSLALACIFYIPWQIALSAAPLILNMPPTWTTQIILDVQNNMTSFPLTIGDVQPTFFPQRIGFSTKIISSTCRDHLTPAGATCTQIVYISTDNIPPGSYNLALKTCGVNLPQVCSQNDNAATIVINGTAPLPTTNLSPTTNNLNFQANGPSQTITITNNGSQTAQGLTYTTPTPNIGVQVTNTTCPEFLPPSSSCQFTVSPGSSSGTTTFNISGANTNSVATTVNVASSSTTTTLSASLGEIALSAQLPRTPRTITITNTGSIPTDTLLVSAGTFPTGTSISSDTCNNVILNPSATCTITIAPDSTATSDCQTGTAPIATTLMVSASNVTTATSTDVYVLDYGCIYASGYIYAIDDTTPSTASIGGKVITQTDIVGANGNYWSQLSAQDENIPGIENGSTSPCNGATDGSCNTDEINSYYASQFPPAEPQHYAAGICIQLNDGGHNWYLPAMCEWGVNPHCSFSTQNINENLTILISGCSGSHCLSGSYWSSTEDSTDAQYKAWTWTISPPSVSAQPKSGGVKNIRCAFIF